MILDLEPVLSNAEKEFVFPVSFEAAALDVPQGHCEVSGPASFPLTAVYRKGKGVCIEGTAVFQTEVPCDRCLTGVPVELNADFSRILAVCDPYLATEGDDVDHSVVNTHEIDIDALVADELQLQWPPKVLCDPECKGLCPVCGQNLNLAECGCDRFVMDPRMAKFADLFSGN